MSDNITELHYTTTTDTTNENTTNENTNQSQQSSQSSQSSTLSIADAILKELERITETKQPEQPSMILNADQAKAANYLKDFLNNNQRSFLLLGPAGTGKTSTITNVFNESKLNIIFCSFTNKATQVLKNMSKKYKITFNAQFSTIHKLLALEPVYGSDYDEVKFNFDKTKINLKSYDVIVFDECSTISLELFNYIIQAWEYTQFQSDKKLKYIFLGDYWQLPPIQEDSSTVFTTAKSEKWPISSLSIVMRSTNELMDQINKELISWVNVFRKPNDNLDLYNNFQRDFPYNMLPKNKYDIYLSNSDAIIQKYLSEWKKQSDIVVITYSRSNCDKINRGVQDNLDFERFQKVEPPSETIWFKVGDRCCVDKPIEVHTIAFETVDDIRYATLGKSTNQNIYNGEIFDILNVTNIRCKTELNKYLDVEYFDGQVLQIMPISKMDTNVYEVIYIPYNFISKVRPRIRSKIKSKHIYDIVMRNFTGSYPRLTYGYCITLYKAQGSEWNSVIVNLSSIKYSLSKEPANKVFRAAYTALTRATTNLWIFNY